MTVEISYLRSSRSGGLQKACMMVHKVAGAVFTNIPTWSAISKWAISTMGRPYFTFALYLAWIKAEPVSGPPSPKYFVNALKTVLRP